MSHQKTLLIALTALLLGVGATSAQAGFVTVVSENACDGVLGDAPNCFVDPDDYPTLDIPEETPLIAKFEGFDNGLVFIAGLFPSITGDEFAFFGAEDGTGTWTYTPDDDNDPLVTAYWAKGGPSFNLFDVEDVTFDGTTYTGPWFTPENMGGNTPALSNFGFLDSGGSGPVVPAPAPVALMALGGLLLGWARKNIRR